MSTTMIIDKLITGFAARTVPMPVANAKKSVSARYYGKRQLPTLFSNTLPIAQWDGDKLYIRRNHLTQTTQTHINKLISKASFVHFVEYFQASYFFEDNANSEQTQWQSATETTPRALRLSAQSQMIAMKSHSNLSSELKRILNFSTGENTLQALTSKKSKTHSISSGLTTCQTTCANSLTN